MNCGGTSHHRRNVSKKWDRMSTLSEWMSLLRPFMVIGLQHAASGDGYESWGCICGRGTAQILLASVHTEEALCGEARCLVMRRRAWEEGALLGPREEGVLLRPDYDENDYNEDNNEEDDNKDEDERTTAWRTTKGMMTATAAGRRTWTRRSIQKHNNQSKGY